MKKIPPHVPRKQRSFNVDEEKETRWAHLPDHRYPLGSDNHPHYSRGNTFLIRSPFGMNYFLPRDNTSNKELGFFNPNLPIFLWFRLTHQPSPWIGDYAWCLITPITEILQVPTSSVSKAVIRWKKLFSSPPLPSNFFGTLSDSKRAGSKLLRGCHALSSTRKADTLLSCSKGTRGLEPYRPNLPLPHPGSDPYLRYFYSFYLQWQFSQPIENVTHIDQDLFSCPFLANEVTVQLGTSLSVSRHGSQPSSQPFPRGRKRSSRSMESAKTNWSKRCRRAWPAFFDHCLYRLLLSPLKPLWNRFHGKWLAPGCHP